MGWKVVITDSGVGDVSIEQAVLDRIGAVVTKANCRTEDEVLAAGADADALIVGYAPITRRVLAGLPKCRVASRYGIGMDMVDIPAATEHGVVACNVPDYCIEEVAAQALALLLALNRQICRQDQSVHAGQWRFLNVAQVPRRLSSQTLGIVAYGRIGRTLARFARGLGLRVLAYDPHLPADQFADATPVDFATLLAEADYLSLHCPLTPETRHLIDAKALRQMKPTACLINVARGAVIDEAALAAALKDGQIAGAGLDVLETEPPRADNPLLKLDNVILTPHAAHFSAEALVDARRRAAEHVAMVLEGQAPPTAFNPEALRGRSAAA